MRELPLPALLAFVEECDLSDAGDGPQQQLRYLQPQPHPAKQARRQSFSSKVSKSRPRRDVIEIAALRSQVQALTLDLDKVKEERQSSEAALLDGPLHWQTEAQRQSQRRTAAQEENERLRAQIQAKVLFAKRLTNVLKRNSPHQMLKMLQRYELDAKLRAEITRDYLDEDLERAYHETDVFLAESAMATLPPVFFDARMRRKAASGISIEFRRCLRVPRDRVATSDAFWQFIPDQRFSERFVFDHTARILDNAMESYFVFQCRRGPSKTQFSGRYQLRRYTTEERVVIVWKTLIHSLPRKKLRLHGRGWVVIQSTNTNTESAPSTSIQTFARYFPESDDRGMLTPEQAQQNEDLRALIEFVTCAMEGYGAFPTQTALLV